MLESSEEEGLKEGSPNSGGAPAMIAAPFTHHTQLQGDGQWERQQETSKSRLQC